MTKKIKEKKKSLRIYIVGIIVLLAIMGIGVYLNSWGELFTTIEDYLGHKQEITDITGKIIKIKYLNKPVIPNIAKTYAFLMDVEGEKGTSRISLQATNKNYTWWLSKIKLSSPTQEVSLEPSYVSEAAFYAASLSSAPLKEPVFIAGEIIFIEAFLKGAELSPNEKITQSMSIYDENNTLIVSNANTAEFSSPTNGIGYEPKQGIRFTNKISHLNPGTYFIGLGFKNGFGKMLELYWQGIKIKKSQDSVFVKSVNYFLDQNLKQNTLPKFDPDQNIYLRVELDGFKVNNNKIAGLVDLKIANSQNDVVAYKPKFASFNQSFDSENSVFVDGHFQLKEPDIYFLSFKITDFFSKQEILHSEKILVRTTTIPIK